MSIISDAWKVVTDLGRFIIGDKKQPKLEDSLGELETEKEKQRIADIRRDRAARKNHDR